MNETKKSAFEEAEHKSEENLLVQLWLMLKQNKKYWMIPLVCGLLLLGLLVIFGTTVAAPFIYALF